jgi:eukaryotic-like serine/threonine-protein kinase
MEPAREEISVGMTVGGTYTVTHLLGKGGMGSVWAANHARLPGKRVAIKVLHGAVASEEMLARFRREAEIASRIGHPNIVEVADWNTLPSGTPYIILEFLSGEPLSSRLKRGAMPLENVLDILRQAGSALNAAHRAGVVHRDLKPDNIFLVPTDSGGVVGDHVKVLDFGISKIRDSNTVQTQEARILGTPQYMSPEQASGKNQSIDQRTDVFALGAITYEMLTGKAPFEGDNLAMVVFKVVFEEPTPLLELVPSLPPTVVHAVNRALAKDPAQRYPDVLSFVADLSGRPVATLDRMTAMRSPSGGIDAMGATMDVKPSGPVMPSYHGAKTPSVPSLAAGQMSPVSQSHLQTAHIVDGAPGVSSSGTVSARPGGSKKGLLILGGLVVAAGIAAAVIVPGMLKKTDGPAVVAGTTSEPASTPSSTPSSIAASTPASSPASEPVSAAVVSSAPASTPASKPVSAAVVSSTPKSTPHSTVESAPAEKPELRAKLDEADAALQAGKWRDADRLAEQALYIEKRSPRAYAIRAKAACGARNLEMARMHYGNIGNRRAKESVKKYCAPQGYELD